MTGGERGGEGEVVEEEPSQHEALRLLGSLREKDGAPIRKHADRVRTTRQEIVLFETNCTSRRGIMGTNFTSNMLHGFSRLLF